jgi:PLP dependent protein
MELSAAYTAIKERLARASAGRPVTLIAVSKTQPFPKIEALYLLGQRDFGENYSQELVDKAEALKTSCPEIRWHFIGHLQSNKVKSLLPYVSSIHSIHSVDLAREISKRWIASGRAGELSVFFEVNIDGEATKSGFAASEVRDAAESVSKLSGLRLEGLMCIPAREASVNAFTRLRDLETSCRPFTRGSLSMGMSSDFEDAIRVGATHIRVGTLLFGERTGPARSPA